MVSKGEAPADHGSASLGVARTLVLAVPFRQIYSRCADSTKVSSAWIKLVVAADCCEAALRVAALVAGKPKLKNHFHGLPAAGLDTVSGPSQLQGDVENTSRPFSRTTITGQ